MSFRQVVTFSVSLHLQVLVLSIHDSLNSVKVLLSNLSLFHILLVHHNLTFVIELCDEVFTLLALEISQVCLDHA